MRPTSFIFSLLLPATTVHGSNKHHSKNHVVSSFKWQRPFPYDGSAPLNMDAPCKADGTFHARQYRLGDLQAPSQWSGAVLNYLGWHPYLGSWDGIDAGGDERDLIIMEYKDVPVAVREWIDKQQRDRVSDKSKWWLYGVFEKPKKDFGKASGHAMAPSTSVAVGDDAPVIPDEDKVLIFAPAALYDILPLWVGKGSDCEGETAGLCWAKVMESFSG